MIAAVTGHRNILSRSAWDVEAAVLDMLPYVKEMRFGGALGVDTIALAAAAAADGNATLRVFCPGRVRDLPRLAQGIAVDHADAFVELQGDPSSAASYHARNRAMVDGTAGLPPCDVLLAFSDGRPGGGTQATIDYASRRVRVVVLPVETEGGARQNPDITDRSRIAAGQIHGVLPYVTAALCAEGAPSDIIRRMKVGAVSAAEIDTIASFVAAYVAEQDITFDAIVAMPRRAVGVPSDLAPLCRRLSRYFAAPFVEDGLQRVSEPAAFHHRGRLRSTPMEHTASLVVDTRRFGAAGVERGEKALLVDNVVTTGWSMVGAQHALKAAGFPSVGLGVLYA